MPVHVRRVSLALALALCACVGGEPAPEGRWQVVQRGLPGALLSIWGTNSTDVWAVGADARDGSGPTVLHFDGATWSRIETGEPAGDLWWVFGFDGGPIFMGGDGGTILRYEGGAFTRMPTPGSETVYGLWGAAPDDMWAVGGASDSTGGFAWRLSGDAWIEEASLPADVPASAAVWKIYGERSDDAWLVGSNGVALHWDGAKLSREDTGVGSSLFTVHARDGRVAAVGGAATGIVVEREGGAWRNVTPDPPPAGLAGVTLGADGTGVAVGSYGALYTRTEAGWGPADIDLTIAENLHGSWIDGDGGLWVVGGQTFTQPLTQGVLVHWGEEIASGDL
ncbi:MAG: hypothetical protein R3A79_26730 [Nannocystaceae bacterium]